MHKERPHSFDKPICHSFSSSLCQPCVLDMDIKTEYVALLDPKKLEFEGHSHFFFDK
jgi:hypothetical protein